MLLCPRLPNVGGLVTCIRSQRNDNETTYETTMDYDGIFADSFYLVLCTRTGNYNELFFNKLLA